jgi:hypothetical protein
MAWLPVTKRDPCPVCKKNDYCTRTADGELVCCMRVESAKPSTNKLGGWLHKLADPLPVVVVKPKEKPVIVDWTNEAAGMYERGADARKKLSKTLGVTVESLEELMVGCGQDEYRTRDCFTSWPERDASGMVVGIVRRYDSGAKKTMKGSRHGLYYGRHYAVMPGPVFLPEGGSDTATLIGLGVNAIGRPSNTGGIGELVAMLRGIRKPVVVLGESDRNADSECNCGWCLRCWPGLAGANLTATRLSEGIGSRVTVRMFRAAKDAREWIKANPTANAADVIDALEYDPTSEPCRVCGRQPPHQTRGREVVCVECRALLENLK